MKTILKELLKYSYETLHGLYLTPKLKNEWKKVAQNSLNERAIEYKFGLEWLSTICPNKILDVGSGKSCWPHLLAGCGFRVTAIDKVDGYWKGKYFNRHFYILNDDITNSLISDKFDFITCISVIEHIRDYMKAIEGMLNLLNENGYIALTFPYNKDRYVENVYAFPEAGYGRGANFICQIFSQKEVDLWVQNGRGKIICQEYYCVFSGELWTFGERILPPRRVSAQEKHHLACVLIQKQL